MTQRQHFMCGEQPTATLVQEGGRLTPSRTDVIRVDQATRVAEELRATPGKSLIYWCDVKAFLIRLFLGDA
jgi:hypothetical protein